MGCYTVMGSPMVIYGRFVCLHENMDNFFLQLVKFVLYMFHLQKSDALELKESDIAMADSLTRDVYMIDKYQSELKELKKKIGIQESRISGSGKC